jgi:ArsR family transcriptional regulator
MDTPPQSHILPVITSGSCCGPVIIPQWTPEQAQHLANQMKSLADPTRIRLLELLALQTEPLCVCDITAQFPQHQPTMSHHLRILREAGLVDCEKRGTWAFYWATPDGKQRVSFFETLL